MLYIYVCMYVYVCVCVCVYVCMCVCMYTYISYICNPCCYICNPWASLIALLVKNPPALPETLV